MGFSLPPAGVLPVPPPCKRSGFGPENFVSEDEWSFGVVVENLVGGAEEKNEIGVLGMVSEEVSGT